MKNAGVVFLIILIIGLGSGCSTLSKPAQGSAAEAASYFQNGSNAFKERNYERAIDDLQWALSLRPDYPEALNLLGIVYLFQKNYPTAQAKFEKAIALDSSCAAAYANLGNLYFMTGRLDRAEEYLKKAVALSPRLASAYYSLGNVCLTLGRTDEATQYLSRGLEIDPSYYDTHKQYIATPSGQDAAEFDFAWARVYASKGDVANTVKSLEDAKRAGFKDWKRLESDQAFAGVLADPQIRKFIKA